MQPGATIKPGEETDKPTTDEPVAESEAKAEPTLAEIEASLPPKDEEPKEATKEPESGWAFKAEEQQAAPAAPTSPRPQSNHEAVTWTASEYVAHDKSPLWYAILAIAGIVVGALAFFISHDIVAPIVIGVVTILFGVSAARKPQVLDYRIDDKGITIGPKHYGYGQFKSFSMMDDGALTSINLLSTKRFMPPLSIYYPAEQEEHIVQKLGDFLPFERHKNDPIDNFMRRIRF